MGIVASRIRAVERQLQDRGFVRRPCRRGAAGARVWVRNDTHGVSVQSIEIEPPLYQVAVEDALDVGLAGRIPHQGIRVPSNRP